MGQETGRQRTRRISNKSAVALLLTFAAGYVDIVGYLTLFHTFTAHMTGNTVHLAEDMLHANWFGAATVGSVIAAFVLTSVLGRTLIEIGYRSRVRNIASVTLALEALLLVAVIPMARSALHGTSLFWLLLMLAGAMGLQTATITRVGALTVHTTFVTGMINKFAQMFSHWLFFMYDAARGRAYDHSRRDEALHHAAFVAAVWVVYVLGAVVGTWMRSARGLPSLWVPVALLGVAVVTDQVTPLAIEEERDQMER